MERLNIIKKTLIFLQEYASSRFGSAVIGFLLCLVVLYYGVIENQINTINSIRNENEGLKTTLKETNLNILQIQEEARRDAQREAREYMNYTLDLLKDIRTNVDVKNRREKRQIQEIEKEIEQVKKEIL